MIPPRPPIVILSDGEENLELYAQLLRENGHDVHETRRPYEAALQVAGHEGACLIARETILPSPVDEFLGPVREAQPGCLVVVSCPSSACRARDSALVDLVLPEPFRFSALLEALEYQRERPSGGSPGPPPPEPRESPGGRLGLAAPRLLACARRLSELERDRDQLLSTALEMFLEIGEAERGSIMLRGAAQGDLELVRRSGFPRESGQPHAVPLGEGYAGRAALEGVPLLGEAQPGTGRPGYRGSSFLVVPLMDHRTVLGVVNLSNKRSGARFSAEDLEVTTFLAQQFTANLANADRLNELQHMTVVDPLTDLFNRRYFDRQLQVELERARRYDRQVTLALVDIDNFKLINDFNGYVTGDRVIKEVATIVRANVREVDIVTRWGGDEFAILLPETGKPRAPAPGEAPTVSYIERVRRGVEEQDFQRRVPGLTGRITVSGGVATFPVDATEAGGLFTLANQALLRAKRAGHNRICIAHGPEGSDTAGAS